MRLLSVGDDGQAVVVDPRWDIDVYLEIARAENLEISQSTSTITPIMSRGRLPLVAETGARSYRPDPEGVRADQIARR